MSSAIRFTSADGVFYASVLKLPTEGILIRALASGCVLDEEIDSIPF